MRLRILFAPLFLAASLAAAAATPLALSPEETAAIGRRIWQNECAGSVEGLTSWNAGEDFASLGIGHFIWYPPGPKGPFEESFPALLKHLEARGVELPDWLRGSPPCPWPDRAAFRSDLASPRMKELRALLAGTVPIQAEFCVLRLRRALPELLAAASRESRPRVETNFNQLCGSAAGAFALVDYVNFKGEGTSPTERYAGQGWGLLQALETMRPGSGPAGFAAAAEQTLERRVRNSPPARNEARWLEGWQARVRAYAKP